MTHFIVDTILFLIICAQWYVCGDYDEIDTEQKRQGNEEWVNGTAYLEDHGGLVDLPAGQVVRQ